MNKQLSQNQSIKKIIMLAKNDLDVEVLWLYGSRARRSASIYSDYDLAVAFKTYINEPIERRLRPELLALKWKRESGIDLSIIDINQVPLTLAYAVVQDNTLLYSKNDYRKLTEEQRVMSKSSRSHRSCVGMHMELF